MLYPYPILFFCGLAISTWCSFMARGRLNNLYEKSKQESFFCL
ncbi:hypothetical protein [Proteus faecis]